MVAFRVSPLIWLLISANLFDPTVKDAHWHFSQAGTTVTNEAKNVDEEDGGLLRALKAWMRKIGAL